MPSDSSDTRMTADAEEEERFRRMRWAIKKSFAKAVNPVLREHEEHAEQLQEKGVIPSTAHAQAACNMILEKFYIGSADTEHHKDLLQLKGITHILQVGFHLQPHHHDTFKYLTLGLMDMDHEDLVKHFSQAFEFIDQGRAAGGVLVHCVAGVSRSASLCIGYLMWKQRIPYLEAQETLAAARPCINPNPGFVAQLREFEGLDYDFTKWEPWTIERCFSC